MYKKFYLFIVLFSFISHCGFTPIYSNKTNYNYSISSMEFEGDKVINKFLKNNLNQFQNEKFEKKYNINVKTEYQKNIISKDKAANTTNYELYAKTNFQIKIGKNIIKELNLIERKIIDKNDDNLEEQKNERTTKQNFASSMSNQLLIELSMLNDN